MLVIDHFWNNELFLIGGNIGSDILLGVLMTLGATVAWGAILQLKKAKAGTEAKA